MQTTGTTSRAMQSWFPTASAHLGRESVYPRMRIGIFAKLVTIACDEAELTKAELIGAARDRHTVCARWSVMVGLRRAGLSLPEIGKLIGNRDHTTVLNGLRRSVEIRLIDERFDLLCRLMEKEADDHTPDEASDSNKMFLDAFTIWAEKNHIKIHPYKK